MEKDARALIKILQLAGEWDWKKDEKLNELIKLLNKTHPDEKVLIFTQFADTVTYLDDRLRAAGLKRLAGVTGDSPGAVLSCFSRTQSSISFSLSRS